MACVSEDGDWKQAFWEWLQKCAEVELPHLSGGSGIGSRKWGKFKGSS